jgi:hypothetical protein
VRRVWRTAPVLAALGGLVLGSAGCATNAQGTRPEPLDTPATVPSAATSPSPNSVLLGQPATADNGQVTATVFSYRQPAAPGGPAGTTWVGADVQVCVQHSAIFDVSISRGPWVLLSREGHTVPATLTDEAGFPQPVYPADHRRLHPGDCVRGWVLFAVPANERGAAVQYAPSGAQPINWGVR